MQKILLVLGGLILSSTLYSQTFAPLGATWHYSTKHNMQDSLRWIKMVADTDTVFAGKNAKQFSFSYESSNALPCPDMVDTFQLAKEGDSLLFYEDGRWQLLVDFNSSVSDSFSISIASGSGAQLVRRTIEIRVDSIAQRSYNGQSLRSIYLRRTNSGSLYDFHDGWFTEVIGHEYAPLPWVNSSCAHGSAYISGRRCYADSIIGNLQFTSYACQSVITNLNELTINSSNTVLFPNPTSSGIINIETKQIIQKISVYNLQGQKVQEIDPKKRRWKLPEEAGLYLIRLQDREGGVYTRKVVKR